MPRLTIQGMPRISCMSIAPGGVIPPSGLACVSSGEPRPGLRDAGLPPWIGPQVHLKVTRHRALIEAAVYPSCSMLLPGYVFCKVKDIKFFYFYIFFYVYSHGISMKALAGCLTYSYLFVGSYFTGSAYPLARCLRGDPRWSAWGCPDSRKWI